MKFERIKNNSLATVFKEWNSQAWSSWDKNIVINKIKFNVSISQTSKRWCFICLLHFWKQGLLYLSSQVAYLLLFWSISRHPIHKIAIKNRFYLLRSISKAQLLVSSRYLSFLLTKCRILTFRCVPTFLLYARLLGRKGICSSLLNNWDRAKLRLRSHIKEFVDFISQYELMAKSSLEVLIFWHWGRLKSNCLQISMQHPPTIN